MQKIESKDEIGKFIHYVSSRKRDFSQWCFLHVKVTDVARASDQVIEVGEIMQLIEFQVRDSDSVSLCVPDSYEVLLLTSRQNAVELSKVERAIYENYASDMVHASLKNLDLEGLERFSKILEPYVDQNNPKDWIPFCRMKRMGNTVLVVDDDIMVLKQMEKALVNFGNVVTLQNAELFDEYYTQYAPNILFLDIHLGSARGNELLKKLTSDVDPYAHVVMISSDTMKETIMDIKSGGAKGFVVKPFNRNDLFQHVIKAPTVNVRMGSAAASAQAS